MNSLNLRTKRVIFTDYLTIKEDIVIQSRLKGRKHDYYVRYGGEMLKSIIIGKNTAKLLLYFPARKIILKTLETYVKHN